MVHICLHITNVLAASGTVGSPRRMHDLQGRLQKVEVLGDKMLTVGEKASTRRHHHAAICGTPAVNGLVLPPESSDQHLLAPSRLLTVTDDDKVTGKRCPPSERHAMLHFATFCVGARARAYARRLLVPALQLGIGTAPTPGLAKEASAKKAGPNPPKALWMFKPGGVFMRLPAEAVHKDVTRGASHWALFATPVSGAAGRCVLFPLLP